jgi:hypothetical protein
VRVPFEMPTVLEGSGLALVGVDAELARSGVGADDPPLARGREPGPTQASQTGPLELGEQLLDRGFRIARGPQLAQLPVAAFGRVGTQILGGREFGLDRSCGHRPPREVERGRRQEPLAEHRRGCPIAGPHTRRVHDPDELRIEIPLEFGAQPLGPREHADDAVADPQRHGGRRGLAFADHVEMGVKSRDLENFRLGELQLFRQRREMRRGKMAEMVLQEMEMLDQERRVARPFAQKCAHLREGHGIDLATFRMGTAATPPRTNARWHQRDGRHPSSPHSARRMMATLAAPGKSGPRAARVPG